VTTAWALPVTVYYLLNNPDTLRKLKQELTDAIPNPSKSTPLVELEQLPYLTGVIQEGLRLSYGICSRLERIAPNETLIFTDPVSNKTWTIPPGTPIAMTSYIIHRNPDIFPAPLSFRPERWVENPRLDKYLISFSKGKMQCLGINLAYAELYLMLAKLFRLYGSEQVKTDGDMGMLKLFDTTFERDIDVAEDRFIPMTSRDTKGVRVLVDLY
jgi:cytochrome P450